MLKEFYEYILENLSLLFNINFEEFIDDLIEYDSMKFIDEEKVIIIVNSTKLSPKAQTILLSTRNMNNKKIIIFTSDPKIENKFDKYDTVYTYPIRNLTINPLQHEGVPPQKIIRKGEVKKILEDYDCDEKNLTSINYTDPMVCWLQGEKGDILEITYRTTQYRLIV